MRFLFSISLAILALSSSTLYATHYWEGDVNHSWNNPGNWDDGTVPGINDDVIILSGTPNECWLVNAGMQCHNLYIMAGASFRVYDETFNVYGFMQIWGQLRMDNSDGFLIVHDNIYWESGSTAQITAYAGIRTYENWEFDTGSSVHLNDGYVQMYGYDNNSIICKSDDSWFNVLVIANNGGEIQYSGASTKDLQIKEAFAISSGDTFRSYSTRNIVLDGTFNYNNGHLYMNYGTFVFNGAPSDVDCNTGDYFNNLTINSTGDIDMVSQLDINGNLTINSGTLDCNNYTIRIVGNWYNNNRPNGFERRTGTVNFHGSSNQYCYGDHFYNLTVDKSSTGYYVSILPTQSSAYTGTFVFNQTHIQTGMLALGNNTYLSLSSLIIDNGSSLNASTSSNTTIGISGTWTDNNTSSSGFFEGTSEVLFTGPNFQYLTCPSLSSYDFFDITVNKSNGYFTSTLDLNIFGDLLAESGGWTFNSSLPDHYFYGDITLDGGGFYEHCNTHFVGYTFQFINNLGSTAFDFGPMTINKGATAYGVTVDSDIPFYSSGGLTIDNGYFKLFANSFRSNGTITINSGGTMQMENGASLQMEANHDVDVNSGGTFKTIGKATAPNLITHYNSGYYSFTVNNNATIGAKYTVFEYMDADGINVDYGSNVNTDFPFDYCTFQNSYYGSTLLKLNCSQSLTIANAIFPSNTWGGFNNVRCSYIIGDITFVWAEGGFSGETQESDPYNVIDWEYEPALVSAKIFLEGPFNSSDMNTDIYSVLPLSQPYSASPWNYAGSETVTSIPADVVDWVLLDIRTTDINAYHATEETSIAKRATFLLNDGTLIDTDGNPDIGFETGIGASDNVYIVISHRNHLPIMSANSLVLSADVWETDLSASSAAIFGGTDVCKYLAPGIYGMLAGDANADGTINENDVIPWQSYAGNVGYFAGDMNMDSQVNNQDKDDTMVSNIGKTAQLP